MSARVLQVIETTLTQRGAGKTLDDPVRLIRQYWTFDGTLLAEVDEWMVDQIQRSEGRYHTPTPGTVGNINRSTGS